MKFSIKDFFSKFDQVRKKLRIWSHLLRKSLMKNFIFCAVYEFITLLRCEAMAPCWVWKSNICWPPFRGFICPIDTALVWKYEDSQQRSWQKWKRVKIQKQSSKNVSRERYSENMQKTYRRTPMSKFDSSAWMFSCKFATYFQNTFF